MNLHIAILLIWLWRSLSQIVMTFCNQLSVLTVQNCQILLFYLFTFKGLFNNDDNTIFMSATPSQTSPLSLRLVSWPVFELRTNKWLSHEPGHNFWLSVQVFGCPYTYTKVSFCYKFMVVCWTTASVFLVVWRLFWLSRAHGQPKFSNAGHDSELHFSIHIISFMLTQHLTLLMTTFSTRFFLNSNVHLYKTRHQ